MRAKNLGMVKLGSKDRERGARTKKLWRGGRREDEFEIVKVSKERRADGRRSLGDGNSSEHDTR
jgi:hypothetical protein